MLCRFIVGFSKAIFTMPQERTEEEIEQMKKESCVLLLFVRGRPFPGSRWFYKEIVEQGLDFKPRDTDILISTFPKCGTNWMKYIVHTIITRGNNLWNLPTS
ncbi:hypothetical protein CDAR_413561 [Caerostris darwini]|uniref:Sulfotransferase domain-containing protein n=1 Tax=Caerostris darwini TaxID=1538125 RepID=A0AAV4TEY9_9ARAC|nr:hypothetical protein CDAR_413561 [Caerostris darwini]